MTRTSDSFVAMPTYARTTESKMRPVHPGSLVREAIKEGMHLTVDQAAQQMGISSRELHDIVDCRAPITPEMADRVGELLGNGSGLWLRMQADYDLRMARGGMMSQGSESSDSQR